MGSSLNLRFLAISMSCAFFSSSALVEYGVEQSFGELKFEGGRELKLLWKARRERERVEVVGGERGCLFII